jgi:hypothetical protein
VLVAAASACAPVRTASVPTRTESDIKPVVQPAPPTSVAPVGPPPVVRGPELPRGGYTLFPSYQLVGFCGTPGAPALGELQGNLPGKATKLEGFVSKYTGTRPTLPVFELIAVVVQSGAGSDGKYRRRVSDEVVDQYLKLAREHRGLLLLNIQPGMSDFPTEVKHFEKYLSQPDVGIALDPEWAMKKGQVPGKFYGQVASTTINEVAAYLSALTIEHRLPEKALVFHQVNGYVLKDEALLKPVPGVVLIKSVDGLGPKHAKIETYDYLMRHAAAGVHAGFKLFFDEDQRNGGTLMSPKEVLALLPQPEYVMYE